MFWVRNLHYNFFMSRADDFDVQTQRLITQAQYTFLHNYRFLPDAALPDKSNKLN
jgi:hypothetical protein